MASPSTSINASSDGIVDMVWAKYCFGPSTLQFSTWTLGAGLSLSQVRATGGCGGLGVENRAYAFAGLLFRNLI